MEIAPQHARILKNSDLAFIIIVTWSDGNTSSHAAGVLFESSDESIAYFPQTPGQTSNDARGSYGAVLQSKKAGEITISATFETPGNADNPARRANDTLVKPCNLRASTGITILDTTTATTPELVVLQDFQKAAFSQYKNQLDGQLIPKSLDISPSLAFCAVGEKIEFIAYATFVSGSVLIPVKPLSEGIGLWRSSNQSVANNEKPGSGIFVGVSAGIVTISVSFLGLRATATLEVAQLCVHEPVDYAIVLDRSASMLAKDKFGISYVETARSSAINLATNRRISSVGKEDQIAIVSFAGLYINANPPHWPTYSEADATLDLPLTSVDDINTIRQTIWRYNVRQPCLFNNNLGTRCASGIGSGLSVARNELNSSRRKTGHKKIVVLLVGSIENIFKPDPQIIAQIIKDEGIVIAVVAIGVPTYHGVLQNIASPNLFFPSATIYELADALSTIPDVICRGDYGYYFYPYY